MDVNAQREYKSIMGHYDGQHDYNGVTKCVGGRIRGSSYSGRRSTAASTDQPLASGANVVNKRATASM